MIRRLFRRPSLMLVPLGLFVLCSASVAAAARQPSELESPQASGLDLSGFDSAVRPQDDLYLAANGVWSRDVVIPADEVEVRGVDLSAVVDARLRDIVQALAGGTFPAGSVEQKIGDYYSAYLDTAAIDRAGLAPISPLVDEIDAIQSIADLARWQGQAQGRLQTPIWLWGGFADFMDPGLNRVMAWQGGLGLPDRDYYLKLDDAALEKARNAYRVYLTRLAELSGDTHPDSTARRVLALETRLAEIHVPLSEARDPSKMYNPLTAAELLTKAPGFDWPTFFEAAQLPANEKVTVTQLATAVATARLYSELPLADWKAYLRLRSLDEAALVLPKEFRLAHFAFHGTALAGMTTAQAREQHALEQVSGALNDALAQQYVARHFPAAHKARVQRLVNQVLAAYTELLTANTWMAPETRTAALDKLSKYKAKIGHPEQWRDYAALQVREDDALGNQHRARRFDWEIKAAAAGKPMNRQAWAMSPLVVNAFYDPMGNEINLTAAILQPPLFDMNADDAANFGGIGAVIGHEISHGFDSMGAQFDGDGVMRNWWTDADRTSFESLGQQLVAQFDQLESLPGKHVNGRLTLQENMADLIGLQIAFKAYQASLRGKAAPVLDGYSGEQRFFLSFAQSWRAKRRDEYALQLLSTDPHAPNEFRVNASVMNLDAFHVTFQTAPGDAMFKPEPQRVRLW